MSLAEFSTLTSSVSRPSVRPGGQVDLPTPEELGGWQPVAMAAEGTMSRIYRAKAPCLGALDRHSVQQAEPGYAVKVLKESWSDNLHAVECFAREAQLGRAIVDPHVISVLASRVKQGHAPHYLVMPWLEGQTLRAELDESGPFGFSEALWIVRQACEGLAALDKLGYYHGDLKPSNLFLASSGHVTLLDLGFARRPDEPRTVSGEIVAGTHLYMAPEVTSSVYRPSIQSDLYSLGVILFELLAGHPPFEGDSAAELIELHRSARVPRLSRLRPGTPPPLCDLVERLLAKQPDRRLSLSDGLIDELVRLEIRTFCERESYSR